jgi:hypothetical protein
VQFDDETPPFAPPHETLSGGNGREGGLPADLPVDPPSKLSGTPYICHEQTRNMARLVKNAVPISNSRPFPGYAQYFPGSGQKIPGSAAAGVRSQPIDKSTLITRRYGTVKCS